MSERVFRGDPEDDPLGNGGRWVTSSMRPNCNLSNLVEMGGQKQHYGEIVNGCCTACGQDEFAPGFLRPSLWRHLRDWLVG